MWPERHLGHLNQKKTIAYSPSPYSSSGTSPNCGKVVTRNFWNYLTAIWGRPRSAVGSSQFALSFYTQGFCPNEICFGLQICKHKNVLTDLSPKKKSYSFFWPTDLSAEKILTDLSHPKNILLRFFFWAYRSVSKNILTDLSRPKNIRIPFFCLQICKQKNIRELIVPPKKKSLFFLAYRSVRINSLQILVTEKTILRIFLGLQICKQKNPYRS